LRRRLWERRGAAPTDADDYFVFLATAKMPAPPVWVAIAV
jgi:hypothetical protein